MFDTELLATFKENPKYLLVLFSGVLIFVELSYILGNLVYSAVLLFNWQESANNPWEAVTCDNNEAVNVVETYLHIKLSMCCIPTCSKCHHFGFVDSPAQREELSPNKLKEKHTMWPKGNPRRSKTVGNRVSDIIELTPPTCWHYVESINNPANCVSSGSFPTELAELSLWWNLYGGIIWTG